MLNKDESGCFQRLFKYPPIETPTLLVKKAIIIRDKVSLKENEKEVKKVKPVVSNNVEKPRLSVSETNGEKSARRNSGKDMPKVKLPHEIVSGQGKRREEFEAVPVKEIKRSSLAIVIGESDASPEEVIKCLDDICVKYEEKMEKDDSFNFKRAIAFLKQNLNQDN